VTSISNQQEV